MQDVSGHGISLKWISVLLSSILSKRDQAISCPLVLALNASTLEVWEGNREEDRGGGALLPRACLLGCSGGVTLLLLDLYLGPFSHMPLRARPPTLLSWLLKGI